jgi:RNA polymerase sigma-70 factor (ECF subfamily)
MIPTLANGQPAAAAYLRDEDGIYRAFGLGVLTVTKAGIARIHVFSDGPDLVTKFDLPPSYPEQQNQEHRLSARSAPRGLPAKAAATRNRKRRRASSW